MNCTDAKANFSGVLDSEIGGKGMQAVTQHLERCAACRAEMVKLSRTQRLVSGLGRKPAPPDLALKLRVMISQEVAARGRSRWEGVLVRWQNTVNAFMVPATAGMVSAIIIFGLLIGVLMPTQLSASNDVPTMLYTPPELASSPFGFEVGAFNDNSLIVEAYVDANGRVQDYRILSAPENAKEIMPELKNMLIFTTFRPATTFGQPTSGRAILSFSRISVRG